MYLCVFLLCKKGTRDDGSVIASFGAANYGTVTAALSRKPYWHIGAKKIYLSSVYAWLKLTNNAVFEFDPAAYGVPFSAVNGVRVTEIEEDDGSYYGAASRTSLGIAANTSVKLYFTPAPAGFD